MTGIEGMSGYYVAVETQEALDIFFRMHAVVTDEKGNETQIQVEHIQMLPCTKRLIMKAAVVRTMEAVNLIHKAKSQLILIGKDLAHIPVLG
ncbi:hypothetical protein BGZ83_009921 [Gryganskiella cystojenkinii]|nr:hypothetical protein BGZ83_009921 [Gryganskiella cystojenkinii]